ncbi:hypothetical protein Tcan_01690, partial [Toxocara canis]
GSSFRFFFSANFSIKRKKIAGFLAKRERRLATAPSKRRLFTGSRKRSALLVHIGYSLDKIRRRTTSLAGCFLSVQSSQCCQLRISDARCAHTILKPSGSRHQQRRPACRCNPLGISVSVFVHPSTTMVPPCCFSQVVCATNRNHQQLENGACAVLRILKFDYVAFDIANSSAMTVSLWLPPLPLSISKTEMGCGMTGRANMENGSVAPSTTNPSHDP